MKKSIMFLALALSLVIVSQAYSEDFDSLMSTGSSALQNGDYDEAIVALKAAVELDDQNAEASKLLGIALNRAGDPAGEGMLLQSLMLEPDDAETNFELGQYYLRTKIYAEAIDFYNETATLTNDEDLKREARGMAWSAERQSKVKWPIFLSLSYQLDSNVILASPDGPLPDGIDEEGDSRIVGIVSLGYNTPMSRSSDLALSYMLYTSTHTELSDYDVIFNSAKLNYTFIAGKTIQIALGTSFDHVNVGGENYNTALNLLPTINIYEATNMFTSISYKLSSAAYVDSDKFIDNSDRDGLAHTIGVSQQLPLGSIASLKVGGAYEIVGAAEDIHAYTGTKGHLTLTAKLPAGITATAQYQHYGKAYEASIAPLEDEDRTETLGTISASLDMALGKVFGINLGYSTSTNDSTLDAYNYDRAVTSAALSARF